MEMDVPMIAPAEGYIDPESESRLAANGLTHRDAVDLILKNGTAFLPFFHYLMM